MLDSEKIIKALPYSNPFLFVDRISHIDNKQIKGQYTYRHDEYFYEGHFTNNKITPGVILIECIAQIGSVAFGVYLLELYEKDYYPIFLNIEADFVEKVLPGETVYVESELLVLRAGYMKTKAVMTNKTGNIVLKTTGSCKFVINE